MQHTKIRSMLMLSATLIVLLAGMSLVPLLAQENTTVITVAIEEWQQQFLNEDIFDAFEVANPDVSVVLVVMDQDARFFGPPQSADDVTEYLENVTNFAGQADLIPYDGYNNPRLQSRAGMYLDITPLLNADPDADLDDFYPAVLQSMQWDNGTWALPLSARVEVVTYDVNAFDEAGLAYPNSSWTLSDFINAGATLAEVDAEGNVIIPGFFGFNTSGLFAAVQDSDFSDPSTLPSLPLINTPENIAMLEEWVAYQEEWSPDTSNGFNFDFNEIPLRIGDTFILNDEVNFGSSDADFEGSLLPNGRAIIRASGYAVSGGTNNPQLAYALLQYMTKTPEIAFAFFGDVPARPSLLDADTSELQIFRPDVSPELQAFIDEAMANAIPESDLHFTQYLDQATSRVTSDDADITLVLQEIEEEQRDIYEAVSNASENSVIEVATPIPTPILSSGEIALTFGIENNFGIGADRSIWQAVIDEFVAQDPQVGQITLNTEFMQLSERTEEQDCFYMASNPVQSMDLTLASPISPFVSTDANLDLDNFVNSTVDQVTRDGTIWALPMSLSPQVMWYNPETFADLGLPEPSNEWTMSEFVDVLNTLNPEIENPAYRSQSFGGTYIYMLIAAYGGIPIDFSTSRYTFNLNDPASIEAIRQTLQLAQDGLIDYQELGGFGGGGFGGGTPEGLFDATLQPNDYRLQNRSEGFTSYVLMFPRGADYTPLSYGLGVGMISSETPAPDACYRWLSFLSRQTDLLNGMPTQIDLFDEAVNNLDDADDVIALYRAYSDALSRPDVVIFPSPFGSTGNEDPVAGANNFIKQNWVNSAFDSIVIDGTDVELALADAQQFIDDYDACTSGLADTTATSINELAEDEINDFFREYAQCAVDVDPTLEQFFGGILDEE